MGVEQRSWPMCDLAKAPHLPQTGKCGPPAILGKRPTRPEEGRMGHPDVCLCKLVSAFRVPPDRKPLARDQLAALCVDCIGRAGEKRAAIQQNRLKLAMDRPARSGNQVMGELEGARANLFVVHDGAARKRYDVVSVNDASRGIVDDRGFYVVLQACSAAGADMHINLLPYGLELSP